MGSSSNLPMDNPEKFASPCANFEPHTRHFEAIFGDFSSSHLNTLFAEMACQVAATVRTIVLNITFLIRRQGVLRSRRSLYKVFANGSPCFCLVYSRPVHLKA